MRSQNTNSKYLEKNNLLKSLVAGAATNTGFKSEDFKSSREKAEDALKSNLVTQLTNLDLTQSFTEMLVDAGHPAPAQWIIDVIGEQPIKGENTWKQQIHQFATRWFLYITNLPNETLETIEIRKILANEANPITWLGNVERVLVPFIMENHLFMTEEQAAAYAATQEQVFEITPDGPKQIKDGVTAAEVFKQIPG